VKLLDGLMSEPSAWPLVITWQAPQFTAEGAAVPDNPLPIVTLDTVRGPLASVTVYDRVAPAATSAVGPVGDTDKVMDALLAGGRAVLVSAGEFCPLSPGAACAAVVCQDIDIMEITVIIAMPVNQRFAVRAAISTPHFEPTMLRGNCVWHSHMTAAGLC